MKNYINYWKKVVGIYLKPKKELPKSGILFNDNAAKDLFENIKKKEIMSGVMAEKEKEFSITVGKVNTLLRIMESKIKDENFPDNPFAVKNALDDGERAIVIAKLVEIIDKF